MCRGLYGSDGTRTPTSGVTGRRSDQLNYAPGSRKSSRSTPRLQDPARLGLGGAAPVAGSTSIRSRRLHCLRWSLRTARTARVGSPVWYRWTGESFQIVVVEGDVKVRHLEGEDSTLRPRRLRGGTTVPRRRRSEPPLRCSPVDVTEARREHRGSLPAAPSAEMPSRSNGRTSQARSSGYGPSHTRVWDLSSILPT